jgi:hypothetical protein
MKKIKSPLFRQSLATNVYSLHHPPPPSTGFLLELSDVVTASLLQQTCGRSFGWV